MSGQYKPLAPLSPDNQGAANIIVAYFLIVSTVIFASVRWAVGAQRLLHLDLDDAFFAGSVVFGVATSVVSHLEVTAGLGRHQATLSKHEVTRYFKLSYADQFLAIIAMTCAKASILLLFRRIMTHSRLVAAFVTISTMIALYFLFSIFATAFQCGLPNPWWLDPATCPTHGRLQYAIITLNMVTDALLAVWILPSVWKVNMAKGSRKVVATLFIARFIVVGVAVGQIVLTARSLSSEDQTWVALPRVIMEQVVVHASIIHATIPRIHGFLANLQTGMLATRITTNIPMTSKDRSSNKRSKGSDNDGNRGSEEGGKAKKRWSKSKSSLSSNGRPKRNNMLYVSSSSHDYPIYEEKESDRTNKPPDADGNIINGMRLRPDILPGTKWSTTIYADPVASERNDRSRAHSASTSNEREMPMGGRIDEETSESSLHEGRSQNSEVTALPSAGQATDAAAQIWKTNEFRMQIEKVNSDGHKFDVTTRENMEAGLV